MRSSMAAGALGVAAEYATRRTWLSAMPHELSAIDEGRRGASDMSHVFLPDERTAFYRVIETRRDIRAFRSDPIPEDILMKILGAAHHAPSVGLMQPWNFIVIHDRATKARVHALFLQENAAAAAKYEGPRAAL